MRKRTISLLLTILMVCGLLVPAASATGLAEHDAAQQSSIIEEGLLLRLNATDLLEMYEVGETISKWESRVGTLEVKQGNNNAQPLLKRSSEGMAYVEFDGTDDQLTLSTEQSLDLNNKGALTIVAYSAYTGEDPKLTTFGDSHSTVYFGETAGWGAIYLSAYKNFAVARFGSGQSYNYLSAKRKTPAEGFVMTGVVKDGATETLYDGADQILQKTNQSQTTAGNQTTFSLGYTSASAPTYTKYNLSELLIYDRALTQTEMQQLQEYFSQKAAIPGDTVPPTVQTMSPAGRQAPIAGQLAITFSEPMQNGGSVLLNGHPISMRQDTENRAYFTGTYSGLTYDTDYTVTVSDFRDLKGNVMETDASHSFHTIASPGDGDAFLTYYVSPTGSDTNDGSSISAPFQTLEKARDTVRTVNDSMTGDIVVYLMDGTWEMTETFSLTAEDSGTNGFFVRYEAMPGAHPVLSGGTELQHTWKKVDGKGYYAISLERSEKLRALYVNGERAYMTSKQAQGRGSYGSYTINGDEAWAWKSGSAKEGTILDAGTIPLDTPNPDDIEMMTKTTWNTAIVCVDKLKQLEDGRIGAKYQMPYGAIVQTPSWGNSYQPTKMQTIFNVFEWLDEPGEFYFDKAKKTLYYYPREGDNMDNAQVVVPQIDTLVKIEGANRSNRVQNIVFSGITFAHTDWKMYEIEGSYGRATVQGAAGVIAYADGNWHPSIYRAYDIGPGAVMASSCENVYFIENTICHTGNDGLSLPNDVVNTVVNGNVIYDLAGSAVLLGHPQHSYIGDKGNETYGRFSEKERYDANVEGACTSVAMTNNYMSDTSKMFWGDAGVMVFHANHFLMQYNYLERTPYSGLSLGWGWWNMNGDNDSVVPGIPSTTTHDNKILNNILVNTIYELDDGGAIYTLGDMPGTEISENYVCGIGTPGKNPHMIRGIHVDEGTRHALGERNVLEIPTKYPCIDCNYWSRKGDNTWRDNYSTSEIYVRTPPGELAHGTTIENPHTSPSGIWGIDVFNILQRAGIRPEYLHNLTAEQYAVQDRLLSTKFILPANQELTLGIGTQELEAQIWLAPKDTTHFEAGPNMTQANGTQILVPQQDGEYQLYIVKDGQVSAPSKGTITVGATVKTNVTDGETYRTSQAVPFVLELDETYLSEATVNGEVVKNGAPLPDAGEKVLKLKDLTGAETTISFHLKVELSDQLLGSNTINNPGQSIPLARPVPEGMTAWLVPDTSEVESTADLIEGDAITKAAADAEVIAAPAQEGKYVLLLTQGSEILPSSLALLTVSENPLASMDGLLLYLNADTLQGEDDTAISSWKDVSGNFTMEQSDSTKQPVLRVRENGMRYVEFDGTNDSLIMNEELNLNQKSNLSVIVFSQWRGEITPTTYGDNKSTVYFGENGSWGSLYLSDYGSFVVTRFGSGQSNNFNKYERTVQPEGFAMLAMTKDKQTEYLYDGGELVRTLSGKFEKTANLQKKMTLGTTEASSTTYYKGYISDVLIFDRTLTQAEIKTISSYLRDKYTAQSVAVTGVELDKAAAELTVGNTTKLTATVQPENATNKNVTWTSDNTEVATVDQNGVVTAVKAGTATITVTTEDGGKTVACTVTVKAAPVPTYTVTVETDGNGTASATPAEAKEGTVITLTATAKEGYHFKAWQVVSGNVQITDNQFTMPAANVTVKAIFEKDKPYGGGIHVTPEKPSKPVEKSDADFYDVRVSDWYYDAVSYVAENGIMTGVNEGKFAPNNAVTRSMVWTVLARMDGVNTEGGSTWYAKAQQWAMDTGVSDGTDPNGSITREQLAAMLYRYAKQTGADVSARGDLDKFTDSAQISDWAVEAMQWAVAEGILTGRPNGTVDPKGLATRAEVATMLMSFCENIG